MRTCSILHHAGLPFLLSGKVEVGASLSNIVSFCSFVLRRPQRALSIRELQLAGFNDLANMANVDADSDTAAMALATVLRLCRNLTHLRLPWWRDIGLAVEVPGAVVSLRNLESLDFGDLWDDASPLLLHLRSPVQHVCLRFRHKYVGEPPQRAFPDCNPIYLLQQIRDTLKTLEVHLVTDLVPVPEIKFLHVTRIYFLARSFHFDSDLFAASFPNLRHLQWVSMFDLDWELAEERRFLNLLWREPETHARAWTTLDVLICDASTVYSMALTCRVQLWHNTHEIQRAEQLRHFQAVLADLRPSHICADFRVTSQIALPQLGDVFLATDVITHIALRYTLTQGCEVNAAHFLVC